MKNVPLFLFALVLTLTAFAGSSSKKAATAASPAAVHASDGDSLRTLGEQRFRANCGRCHRAPQKFPPRAMSTVIRHMRVRATLTDEDMRLIIHYMSE